MIFRKGKAKVTFKNKLRINNTNIKMVTKTKFLGVMIDDCLSFIPHIKYIKGKVARASGVLYKCRKYFKSDTLRSF